MLFNNMIIVINMDCAAQYPCLEEALPEISGFKNIHVRGLMAIPPKTPPEAQNDYYFLRMRQLFVDIQSKKIDNVNMDFLSMGMSGDFEDAIAEGANMVRVGSAIFGARDYGAGR